MSTAKKRTIKYVALVSALVLVVSYFSLLSPTSAYFYKTETQTTTIEFAAFDVDEEQTVFDNESVLNFKGATKLCDTDELLFDEVVIEKEVTLINSGEAPARIYVHITPTEESVTNGLRYVAFLEKLDETNAVAEGEDGDETTPSETVQKGALKTSLEEMFEITEDSEHEAVEASLNEYNENFKSQYVVLAPGEKAKVNVVFWAEYGPVKDFVESNGGDWENAGSLEKIDYLCHVEIIASQDENAAADTLFEETTVAENTEEQ